MRNNPVVVDDEEQEIPPKKKKAGAAVKQTPAQWQKIAEEMTSGPVKSMPAPPKKKVPAKPMPEWKKVAAAMAGKY